MKRNFWVLVLVFLAFIGGYMSKETYVAPNISEKYGELRVPIPSGCDLILHDFSHENVGKVEVVDFDLNVRGVNASDFLLLNHTGYPDTVLLAIKSHMKSCIPDRVVSYDNSGMLASDMQRYFSDSYDQPIRLSIQDGKATVVY